MNGLIKEIATNPNYIAFGWTITIISLLSSYYFYKKSHKEKLPKFKITSRILIRDYNSLVEDLSISYCNERIDNLTITNIALWNAGKETINKSDLVTKDKLRIELLENENYSPKLLYAGILIENNRANNFLIETIHGTNEVCIDFDYIDHNDGVVLKIIHTGTEDKMVKISGSIKGYGKLNEEERNFYIDNPVYEFIHRVSTKFNLYFDMTVRKIYPYFILLLSLEIFYVSFFNPKLISAYMELLSNNIGVIWKFASLLMLLISILYIYSDQKLKIPKNLEILNTYFDEF